MTREFNRVTAGLFKAHDGGSAVIRSGIARLCPCNCLYLVCDLSNANYRRKIGPDVRGNDDLDILGLICAAWEVATCTCIITTIYLNVGSRRGRTAGGISINIAIAGGASEGRVAVSLTLDLGQRGGQDGSGRRILCIATVRIGV